jgi:8-oxo-dGTP pyrophosphatase MutT (NUDIX family)
MEWTWDKLSQGYRWIRRQPVIEPAASNWIERLNQHLSQHVTVRRVLDEEPVIQRDGILPLTNPVERLAATIRRQLAINDPVAVVSGVPIWTDNPVTIHARDTDYASVSALDQRGSRPRLLSANVLLYCIDTDELILHRRAAGSRDYPGAVHTFGGCYIPPSNHRRDYDLNSLVRAAVRETFEESGIAFEVGTSPLLLSEEAIGFLNLALLGRGITRQSLDRARENHEGQIIRIKAADLPHRLQDPDWVPCGKAQVLAWLALGAPVGDRRIRFQNEPGQKLFNRLIP